MSQYKVGVVGLGALGKGLTRVSHDHPHTTVVAVCDVNEQLLKEAASKLEINNTYISYAEMFANEDLDLVYISVPPAVHHPVVTAALERKLHVICEKPLANSIEEAKEMLQAAQKSNVVHAINFPINYMASVSKMAQLLEENYIGRLRKIELMMRFPQWPRDFQQSSWINSREQGGFVFEVAGHYIQLIERTLRSCDSLLMQ